MTRARLLTVGLFVTVFAIGIGFAHVYLTRAGGALDPARHDDRALRQRYRRSHR